jgi:hypothetical protein
MRHSSQSRARAASLIPHSENGIRCRCNRMLSGDRAGSAGMRRLQRHSCKFQPRLAVMTTLTWAEGAASPGRGGAAGPLPRLEHHAMPSKPQGSCTACSPVKRGTGPRGFLLLLMVVSRDPTPCICRHARLRWPPPAARRLRASCCSLRMRGAASAGRHVQRRRRSRRPVHGGLRGAMTPAMLAQYWTQRHPWLRLAATAAARRLRR